jgi:hypothetical protein
MNILEAAATGCRPLIHRYPGAKYQWPKEWVWDNLDELIAMYEEPYKPEEYRDYIVEHYDYRKTYEPVVKEIES